MRYGLRVSHGVEIEDEIGEMVVRWSGQEGKGKKGIMDERQLMKEGQT